ncbi:MAG: hypothetical protein AB1846_12490 [Chloroflexota bacterium]
MTELVIHISKEELRELIEAVIDEKFTEFFGDPDEGLELLDSVKDRLERQRQAVARGEFGKDIGEVIKELKLD